MLLLLDIGNSNLKSAIFDGEKIAFGGSLADPALFNTFFLEQILDRSKISKEDIEGVAIASVAPRFEGLIIEVKKFFGFEPFLATSSNSGISMKNNELEESGIDRICNAVAAFAKYQQAAIVVDLGTATTLEVINNKGIFLGGPITLGLEKSNQALTKAAEKLPYFPIEKKGDVIGVTTKEAIQSGIYYGHVGLVDELVKRCQKELKETAKVIATGGFASLIAEESKTIEEVDPLLTLRGLKIIWKKNH